MIRKFLTLVLAGCCGWTFAGQAAQAATAAQAAAPAISDAEVVRYLNPAELTQWRDAGKKIADGQSEVSDGKFLQASTSVDTSEAGKAALADTKKKGDAKVKEGTALIKDGTTAQDKLRKVAIAARDAAHQQAAATAAASFTAPIAQWPEAMPSMTAKLMSQIWDEKYTQVYFGGVYAFEEPKYTAKPELSAQILNQLHVLDKGKSTLADVSADKLMLAQDGGKLIVDYPSRVTDQQSGTKAALIVGELLYETNNGYAAFSLRAIDLSNLHVVASQLMMLSVEPGLAKMIGVPAYWVMARRVQPPVAVVAKTSDDSSDSSTPAAPAAAEAAPTPAITVNLQDPNDILASFKKPPYVFRMVTSGRANTLENRLVSLMVKSYFHDLQPDVAISDQDFLALAMPAAPGTDTSANAADVNTAWVLPNVGDLDVSSIDLGALTARDLKNNATVKIGKITIDRALPRQDLPPASELRASGYSASAEKTN